MSARARQKLRESREEEAYILRKRLIAIYDQMLAEGRFELSRDLDFQVVTKEIDGKKTRVAKLKGNKILVSVNGSTLPTSALKYIIAHEIAHKFTKKHSDRFWRVIENLYPSYKRGQALLNERYSPSSGLDSDQRKQMMQ